MEPLATVEVAAWEKISAAIGRETEAKAEPSLAEAKLSQPEVEPRQAESESGRESGRRAG